MFTVTDSICSSVHIGQLASFPGSPRARTSDGKLGGAWEQGYRVASYTSLFLKGLHGWVQGYIYQRQLMVYLRIRTWEVLCVTVLCQNYHQLATSWSSYIWNIDQTSLHGLWKELHEEYEDDCSVHFQPIAPSLPLFSNMDMVFILTFISSLPCLCYFWHAIPKSLFGIFNDLSNTYYIIPGLVKSGKGRRVGYTAHIRLVPTPTANGGGR